MLGEETCQPVGWVDCPPGFERPANSWGCVAVMPAAPCTGATMERLGASTCQPVGACDRFPPTGATLFVDDDGPQDSTHFRTIGAALAAAPDRAIIAVEAGTYAEAIEFSRPATVVGRCAAQVRLERSAVAAPGVGARRPVEAELRGVTLDGFFNGAGVSGGAKLTLAQVVITQSSELGLYAAGLGSTLSLSESVVRDSTGTGPNEGQGALVTDGAALTLTDAVFSNHHRFALALGNQTRLTARRLVLRDTRATSTGFGGMAINAGPGAELDLAEAVIANNRHRGIALTGAKLTLRQSVVRDTAPQPDGLNGTGLLALQGSTVVLDQVSFVRNHDAQMHVQDPGSSLTVDRASVWDGRQGAEPTVGVSASLDANLVLAGSVVAASPEFPVSYFRASGRIERCLFAANTEGRDEGARTLNLTSACVEVDRTVFEANAVAGVAIVDGLDGGCPTRMTRTLIRGTTPNSGGLAGRGMSVHASQVELVDTVFRDNAETGLWVSRGSTLQMKGGGVVATRADGRGLFGYGVVVRQGSLVTLDAVTLERSHGVGLALEASGAVVRDGVVAGNGIAFDVRAGTVVVEGRDGGLSPLVLRVSRETVVRGNAAVLGNGVVPLPDVQ